MAIRPICVDVLSSPEDGEDYIQAGRGPVHTVDVAAAIDIDGVAGDVAAIVAGEEKGHRSDIEFRKRRRDSASPLPRFPSGFLHCVIIMPTYPKSHRHPQPLWPGEKPSLQ